MAFLDRVGGRLGILRVGKYIIGGRCFHDEAGNHCYLVVFLRAGSDVNGFAIHQIDPHQTDKKWMIAILLSIFNEYFTLYKFKDKYHT